MRSRRHELGLGNREIFPGSAHDGFQPRGTSDPDGADDGSDYSQGSHCQEDVVRPAHGLAHELHRYPFSEEGQQPNQRRNMISKTYLWLCMRVVRGMESGVRR